MSAISNASNAPLSTPESPAGPSPAVARRRRRIVVNSLRVGLLVVIIGGWELATRVGIIDKFFWGQPSGIWAQLVNWATQGTAQGPLWQQIANTLEETVLGLGVQSKVALAVILVFFIVFFNAFQGVREVDRNLLANARILGANQRQL